MPKLNTTVEQRFWERVSRRGKRQCWLWTGGKSSQGYGVLWDWDVKKHAYAHRYSWELANGAIPKELQVNHKCDVPLCVNPDHLFLGRQLHNIWDAMRKGRMRFHFARKAGTA